MNDTEHFSKAWGLLFRGASAELYPGLSKGSALKHILNHTGCWVPMFLKPKVELHPGLSEGSV